MGEEFVQRPAERYLKYKKLHHCPKHGDEVKPEDCELCQFEASEEEFDSRAAEKERQADLTSDGDAEQ